MTAPVPARPNLHVALALAHGRQPTASDHDLLTDVIALRAATSETPQPPPAARYRDVPLPGMEDT